MKFIRKYFWTWITKKDSTTPANTLKKLRDLQQSELLPNVFHIRLNLQMQPWTGVLQNRCSWKLCKFHRKKPVLEPLFNKVAGLKACNFIKKRLQRGCLLGKFAKFLRTPVLENICERLLLQINFLMTNNLRRRYLVKCQWYVFFGFSKKIYFLHISQKFW